MCPRSPALARALAALDVLCALAERSLTLNWCAPQFVPEPCIEIEAGPPPGGGGALAETAAAPSSPTTPAERQQRMQIITGPNMGGKSPTCARWR
jgi:DNA mismatch repair protein MutS